MENKRKVKVILKDKRTFTGTLIPETEFSKKGTLVLKLGNGYNIGLSSDSIQKVEEISTEKMPPLPKLDLKGKGPRISVIGTGGTISSRVDYVTGGVEASMNSEEIFGFVPQALDMAELNFVNAMHKLSEDMTPKNWQTIAGEIFREMKDSEGVVVLHGTDTMHYTSSVMSFMIDTMKPIVFTGAQRSSDRPSTDAFVNILCSIGAAKSGIPESMICFHSQTSDSFNDLIRGNRARKMHTSARSAFKSVNIPPLGKVYPDGRVELDGSHLEPQKPKLMDKLEEKVAIVKTFPGADPAVLEFYASKGYKGLIIEGTGLGHVPVSPDNKKSWIPVIEKLIPDVSVVVTSQTIFGRTHKNVYTNLRKLSRLGVNFVDDMTTEAAYAKLMWALGNFKEDAVNKIMQTNLKGEIFPRTTEV